MNCRNPPRILCNDDTCIKCFNNSFASHEKARYWSKRNELKARFITRSSNKKIYFDCDICDHIFISRPSYITRGTWCPYCANKKLCDENECIKCYNNSFASHEKSAYWSKSNECNPRDVFKSAGKKYQFECSCGHTFESMLHSISDGFWCPYCANIKLCTNDDCKSCFNKSFASNEKSIYWSNKNNILPRNVFNGTSSKYIFDCHECLHSFETRINGITGAKQTWCPYCGFQILCDDNDCKFCYEKSFASVEKSKYWSLNNIKNPRDLFKSSAYKGIFDCPCGHTFEILLYSVTTQGHWCLYCCASAKKLCDDDSCINCFNNSFASIHMSKYWSKLNDKKPRQVFKHTGREKYKFDCPYCNNIYESCPYNVTNGIWCTCITNKTEAKLYNHLVTKYSNEIEKQKKFNWCKNISYLPFDFCIEEYKLIIELDGGQHFFQVSNWQSPEETQKNDKYKTNCANKNGYSVIRLLQDDVWNDKNNWQSNLKNAMKKYDDPINIYFGDCYNNWKGKPD